MAEFIVNRNKITRPPSHPGLVFGETVLPELRKARTLSEIATLLGISRTTLHRLVAGEIAVSPDMAVRLGKMVGNGPGLWIRLQGAYDTWEASHRLRDEIKKIPTLTP